MGRILLLGCLMVVSSLVQAGELYRWVDAKGKVQYGDTPPAEATLVESLDFYDEAAPDAGMPYETRRAQKNFPVTLYVADNCGEPCELGRQLLGLRGIPFSEKKLATQEEIDAFKAMSGSDNVPTLAVGKDLLQGFEAGQWNSQLDIAGYPKTAPYRAPAANPAPAKIAPGSAPAETAPAVSIPADTAPTKNTAP